MHELRALGYAEGQNLILEHRSAEGRFERFTDILTELVRKTDVIAVTGDDLALRAKQITTTVPIVMVSSRFPLETGLVQSLSRPGGNITGLTINAGPDIEAKRLELLKTVVPRISRVAFLGRKTEWENPIGEAVRAAARTLGIALRLAEHSPDDYAEAFSRIIGEKADALFAANSPPNFAHRQAIDRRFRPQESAARHLLQPGARDRRRADVLWWKRC